MDVKTTFLNGILKEEVYVGQPLDYGHIKWIEDLVPRAMWIQQPIDYNRYALWGVSHWGRKRQQFYGYAVNQESALDVYSKRRIIAVTELKIVEWHDYKHLDWISVRRDDDQIYKFKEGDFKRLLLQDIEDMLLLLVQGKLSNLTVEERFDFNKRLNLTKPDTYRTDLRRREAYTAYSNPRGFIYQNKDKKNILMRIDELYKFSDETLNDVRKALDDRLKGIRMQYLPTTIWRRGDKDRAAAMIQAIEKMLKTMRILKSLEKYVGGRLLLKFQVAQKKVKIAFENDDSSLRVELIPSKIKYANKVVLSFHNEFLVFPILSRKENDGLLQDQVFKNKEEVVIKNADEDVTLKEVVAKVSKDAKDDKEEPAKLKEVIKVVTTAKLMSEVVTVAATTITATPSVARRRKGIVIRDPEETATPSVIVHFEPKSKDKGKGILVKEPKPLKKQVQIEQDEAYVSELEAELNANINWNEVIEQHFNSIVAFLEKGAKELEEGVSKAIKRKSESSKEKAAKKQKLNEEATLLALKVTVVDYQIRTENNKPYYKIITADGTHQLFLSLISLLTNFDREDLEMLWKIVQERFASSEPKNFLDDFLVNTLKSMFEKPNVEAHIWKNQRGIYG
uniref:Reverse transcriptase Ty1/copia-type domain-containing protein n=1 Tax=Tanacetum cinerariifolium TaxID=118510 RepID=A0A6L2KYW2_TANCI|nr:hypothetical protein [Tanacetum cinerariifolium]